MSVLKPPTPKTKWNHAVTTTAPTTAPLVWRMLSVHLEFVGRFMHSIIRSLVRNDQGEKAGKAEVCRRGSTVRRADATIL
jgi:hypothetical protein